MTWGKKGNISLAFISKPCFKMPKNIRINMTHFIMKTINKRKLQQIMSNRLSDISLNIT